MIVQKTLQNSASRVLAAALSDCLPGLMILDIGNLFGGFYCDFSFFGPMTSEILNQLEERMRQIIREQREIRCLEMVPYSASEMLKKSGQTDRAAQVLQQDGYVRLIQIGSFVDWSEGDHLRHTKEAGVIRLFDKKNLENNRYRIFGMAALSKKELTHALALWKQYPSNDHDLLGMRQDLWQRVGQQRIWLMKGLEMRRRLCDFWRKAFSHVALEAEGDGQVLHQISSSHQGRPIMIWTHLQEQGPNIRGLFDELSQFVLQIKTFSDEERSCISFLQTVHQSLTILGFTFRIRLIGKKLRSGLLFRAVQQCGGAVDFVMRDQVTAVEFVVEDAMKCEWVVAEIREPNRNDRVSLTLWVERNLALLLEKCGRLELIAGDTIEN